jgi:hypothetical protein
MSSDEQIQRDVDASVERGGAARTTGRERGGSTGVRSRLGRLFSLKTFLVAFVVFLVGLFVVGSVPIVGFLGGFVGLFVVAFGIGLVASRRRYAEVGLAGGLAAGASFVASVLGTRFLPIGVRLVADYGTEIAAVGVGAGALVALVGYYFGRDLRSGLTRELT